MNVRHSRVRTSVQLGLAVLNASTWQTGLATRMLKNVIGVQAWKQAHRLACQTQHPALWQLAEVLEKAQSRDERDEKVAQTTQELGELLRHFVELCSTSLASLACEGGPDEPSRTEEKNLIWGPGCLVEAENERGIIRLY